MADSDRGGTDTQITGGLSQAGKDAGGPNRCPASAGIIVWGSWDPAQMTLPDTA